MAEQLRIPSVWLLLLVFHIVEVIHSVVEHLGDDEGTFPSRRKLVGPLLIHSEHKVSFLKCSTSHVSGMELTEVLLINRRPDQSHLSCFFQEVNNILSSLFCFSF